MRKTLLAFTTLAFAATSSLAFAATSNVADGTIKTIDSKAMTITLDDGKTYHVPKTFKLASLKTGEKVKVSWSMKGNNYDAWSITTQ